jgi:membrane protein implicated in regulation of membrane protease activity
MIIVAIAWIYGVLMMAIAEAMSSQGTLLGAAFTFLMYGALPLSIVLYILGAPARRRRRRRDEAVSAAPDGGSVAPAASIAPEREEA